LSAAQWKSREVQIRSLNVHLLTDILSYRGFNKDSGAIWYDPWFSSDRTIHSANNHSFSVANWSLNAQILLVLLFWDALACLWMMIVH
jgi:hypothetical protein